MRWSTATLKMKALYARGEGHKYTMRKRWWGYEIVEIPEYEQMAPRPEKQPKEKEMPDIHAMANRLRKMRAEIDKMLESLEPPSTRAQLPPDVAAFDYGRQLYFQGVGLSNVHGDCAEKHFPYIHQVLEGWVSARDHNPTLWGASKL